MGLPPHCGLFISGPDGTDSSAITSGKIFIPIGGVFPGNALLSVGRRIAAIRVDGEAPSFVP